MRPARFLKIAAAAALAAVVAAEAWSLSESYRDARACLNALPALEESGEITVTRLVRSAELPGLFEVGYRVSDPAGARLGRLRCAFSDGLDGRRHLTAAELSGRPVGEARLYFLERFWLGDASAIESGATRLGSQLSPLDFLVAVVGRPRPSLLVILLIALLATAVLAGGRFAGRRRQG